MTKLHQKLELLYLIIILGLFFSWFVINEKNKEIKELRSLTSAEVMADEYCASLKYEEETYAEKIKFCLEYSRQNPLETAKKLFK